MERDKLRHGLTSYEETALGVRRGPGPSGLQACPQWGSLLWTVCAEGQLDGHSSEGHARDWWVHPSSRQKPGTETRLPRKGVRRPLRHTQEPHRCVTVTSQRHVQPELKETALGRRRDICGASGISRAGGGLMELLGREHVTPLGQNKDRFPGKSFWSRHGGWQSRGPNGQSAGPPRNIPRHWKLVSLLQTCS